MGGDVVKERARLTKEIMDMSYPCSIKLLSTLLQFSDDALVKLRDEILMQQENGGFNDEGQDI